MSEKFNRRPLRGMEDFYPEKLRIVNYILDRVKDIAEQYGYEEFEGPLLEPIEIFAAKSSDELVNTQSFIVEKKEGERLILRPELTPTLARMIARKSQEFKKPIRWFSIPTCYRYERPQRGRKREFKQINFDILGDDGLYGDLEMLNIIIDILTTFGATSDQFQIYYNNRRFIDAICQILLEIPKEKMSVVYNVLDKSDKMEEDEFEKYVIDTFQNEWVIQGIFKLRDADDLDELMKKFDDVPKDFFASDGFQELKKLENLIKKTGISEFCSFSSSVVRGLDYYTGTVFEVFDTGQENRRAITGGGRYDDLLTLFSDEELSGIGFGMGVLTLKLFLDTYDLLPRNLGETKFSDTIYITCVNENVDAYAFKLANIIREAGIPCIIDYSFEGLGNQLSKANDLNIPICLILGPNEMEEEKVTIKNMRDESQKTIKKDVLLDEIKLIFTQIDSLTKET